MLFRSDRKSTRLNSSHTIISYAVFCLKKQRKEAEKIGDEKGRELGLWGVGGRRWVTQPGTLSYALLALALGVLCFFPFFFFLKKRAPPKSTPFPHPPPFPT